jgi:hypothetical protein
VEKLDFLSLRAPGAAGVKVQETSWLFIEWIKIDFNIILLSTVNFSFLYKPVDFGAEGNHSLLTFRHLTCFL